MSRSSGEQIAHYERVLGTSLELRFRGSPDAVRTAEEATLALIDRLEKVFSVFDPESELSFWQRAPVGVPAPVSPELGAALATAERWRARTGGAFDPAALALTRLWEDAARQGAPPDLSGWARHEGPLWRLAPDAATAERLVDLPISLNAFAKGLIVDRVCEQAVARPGIVDLLINLGGDLRVAGPGVRQVSVADPRRDIDNAPPLATLRIQDRAVASSGGARRGFAVGEAWRSHLLDPRTGQALDPAVGACVVALCAADADVLATACCVLGADHALALVESVPGAACLRIDRDGKPRASARWRRYAV